MCLYSQANFRFTLCFTTAQAQDGRVKIKSINQASALVNIMNWACWTMVMAKSLLHMVSGEKISVWMKLCLQQQKNVVVVFTISTRGGLHKSHFFCPVARHECVCGEMLAGIAGVRHIGVHASLSTRVTKCPKRKATRCTRDKAHLWRKHIAGPPTSCFSSVLNGAGYQEQTHTGLKTTD